jgi:hypothetical protein
MKKSLQWMSESYLLDKFPKGYFKDIVQLLQKNYKLLSEWIPLDLTIKVEGQEVLFNSLLLGRQSFYFERLLAERKSPKIKILTTDELPLSFYPYLKEFYVTAEVSDLWKLQPDDLWKFIEHMQFVGLDPAVQAAELVLKRYIDRGNMISMLLEAHKKRLSLLQNFCCDFINSQNLNVHLSHISAEFLALEFLNYKGSALDVFDSLKEDVTHLLFSGDLTSNSEFAEILRQSKKLKSLNLSDTKLLSPFLNLIPETVTEIQLSRCRWLNSEVLKIISKACPDLYKLDLSSNEHFGIDVWGELLHFTKLQVLSVARCYQIGDSELEMILQNAPSLVDFYVDSCQRITEDGFFEIPKQIPNVVILGASKTNISDGALIDIFTRSRFLMEIDLSRCHISEKGILEAVRSTVSLRTLQLTGCNISNDTLEKIKEQKPLLNVLR